MRTEANTSDIHFTCPECSQHLSCAPTYAGDHIPCPNCGADTAVPRTETRPRPLPPIIGHGHICAPPKTLSPATAGPARISTVSEEQLSNDGQPTKKTPFVVALFGWTGAIAGAGIVFYNFFGNVAGADGALKGAFEGGRLGMYLCTGATLGSMVGLAIGGFLAHLFKR